MSAGLHAVRKRLDGGPGVRYPQTYGLNPWEMPTQSDGSAFFASWSLVFSTFATLWTGIALRVGRLRKA